MDHEKMLAFALREQQLQEILSRGGMHCLGFSQAMWGVRMEAHKGGEDTSSSGRDSTVTQDMAWLQKGARFQLASQGPGLCCGWLVRPGAGTFCPLASSLLDPQQHSSLNSRQPEGRDVSARPGRGVWHGRGRGGSNRPGFSQPARARNTVSLSLDAYRFSASDFQPKVKPKCTYDCASAKSSSLCQLRPEAPSQGSPHQTLQWRCGAQCTL